MKSPLVVMIIIVVGIIGFLAIYSQTGIPEKPLAGAPVAGGYGAKAGGYGASAGGYGASAGGYGAASAGAAAGKDPKPYANPQLLASTGDIEKNAGKWTILYCRDKAKKANAAYCQKLEEALEKEPSEYGYGFTIWTTDRLRQHLEKEPGLLLSNSRFRALMKKKAYRYRRPKYDLSHLQDAEAKEEAEKVQEKLKKRASKTISGSSLWTK